MKNNVAIVCHDSSMSGANKALLDWIRTIKSDDRYKIVIVLPKHSKEFERMCLESGIEVIIGNYAISLRHLSSTSFIEKVKNVIKHIYYLTFNIVSLAMVKRKLEKLNISIIHTNSFATVFGVQLAIKMNIPHIWHIREFMEEDHEISHYFPKKVGRYMEYSNLIFISNSIKEKYEKRSSKLKKLVYDNVEYQEDYTKNRKFFEDDECCILIAGILQNNKGQIEAIKAIQYLNSIQFNMNIKLYICGEGPNKKELQVYVKRRHIKNIIFMGYLKDLVKIRRNMDIGLTCSQKEAFGRVTIEAMYYQNLVIAAKTGGTVEIVKDGENGLLYKKGDYIELANKILYAIENVDKVNQITSNAKMYAINNFNKNIKNKIFDFYDIVY